MSLPTEIVIVRQDVAVKAEMEVLYNAPKQFKKLLSVTVVLKDHRALVAAGSNVITRARVLS